MTAITQAPATDAGTVTRHWGTPITLAPISLDAIVSDEIDRINAAGPAFEIRPLHEAVADAEALHTEFRSSFHALSDAQGTPPPTDLTVEVQVWRHGYDEPATGHAADWVGWCFLAASPAPAHAESGALAVADPRAGSAMTAMPGLPWGRQVMVPPIPGAHLAAPGWPTTSVVPLERGQYAVVAFASSVR